MQIDGVRNPKMQSVFLDDMPIHRAAFASGGSQVLECMQMIDCMLQQETYSKSAPYAGCWLAFVAATRQDEAHVAGTHLRHSSDWCGSAMRVAQQHNAGLVRVGDPV